MLDLLVKNWKLKVWCSLFHFFHVICKISNFNMWTAKHLAQASCTELTLPVFAWCYHNIVLQIKTKQFSDHIMQKLVKTQKSTNKQSDVKFWLNWNKNWGRLVFIKLYSKSSKFRGLGVLLLGTQIFGDHNYY